MKALFEIQNIEFMLNKTYGATEHIANLLVEIADAYLEIWGKD